MWDKFTQQEENSSWVESHKNIEQKYGSKRFVREGTFVIYAVEGYNIVNIVSTIHTKSKEIFYSKLRSKARSCTTIFS